MDNGGAEEGRVERQISAEQQGDERGRDERNTAVKVDRVRDPVDRAGEKYDAVMPPSQKPFLTVCP